MDGVSPTLCCLVVPIFQLFKRINCGRLLGVSIPTKGGKTNLLRHLESNDIILLDLDSVMEIELDSETQTKLEKLRIGLESDSYNNAYFPLCKKYVENFRKNFKHKNIIILHSSPALLQYLGCRDIVFLSPSNSLLSTILNTVKDEDINKLILKSRELIIKHANKKLLVYNSWQELQDLIKSRFKLKNRL